MADVVVENLNKPRTSRGRKGVVRERRLRDAYGRTVKVLSLDANSATFADDLTLLFERNVAKARRENKKLFGSADGLQVKKK
jgi:hypothetical protein